MTYIQIIIEESYPPDKAKEYMCLLEEYSVLESIESVCNKIISKVEEAEESEISKLLTIYSSTLLNHSNNILGSVTDIDEKIQLKHIFSRVAKSIIFTFFKRFPNQIPEICNVIVDSLINTCDISGYDYSDLEEFLPISEYKELAHTITGSMHASEIKKVESKTINWTLNDGCLDVLTSELKDRKWIQSKSNFTKLFGHYDTPPSISWDIKKAKYHLARLLFCLKEAGFVVPKNGYFAIAEKRIIGLDGETLTGTALRKISSKISNDKDKYITIILEVDSIMDKVQAFVNKTGVRRA